MKKGTLGCLLFGHKFHAERVELLPHYLKLVESGLATGLTKYDFHMLGFQTDYCVRCGVDNDPSK